MTSAAGVRIAIGPSFAGRPVKGSTGYSWGSLASGDQMFYATIFRGRSGTIIAALCAAALVALAVVLFW